MNFRGARPGHCHRSRLEISLYPKTSATAKLSELISAADYLERERAAGTRSEYINGVIVAMAGGTMAHDIIAGNIYAALHLQMSGRPCRVFTANMKVRIERANLFRYPDISALGGPVALHDSIGDVYLNPSFLCEVLSPGTEAYDLGEKFALYRLLDSFVEYLVAAQDCRFAQLVRRSRHGGWETTEFTELEDVITLESINCSLRVADVYDKVDFPP